MNFLFGGKKEAPKQVTKQQIFDKKDELRTQQKPQSLSLGDHSKKVKIQELNANVLGMDKELADMYIKMKKAKGRQQDFYKNRCVMLMKKRKMYQQQIDNLVGQQFSVDQIAITQDNIKNTLETTTAIRDATYAQKAAMKDINVDMVEDLRDEMEDMEYENKEINELLARDYTVDVDESELDDELKELDNEFFIEMMKNQNKPQQQQQATTNKTDLSVLANKAQNLA